MTAAAVPGVVLVPLISFHFHRAARPLPAPFSTQLVEDLEFMRATVEDLEFMRATGESWLGACRRLGWTPAALEWCLHRCGRHDLARKATWA